LVLLLAPQDLQIVMVRLLLPHAEVFPVRSVTLFRTRFPARNVPVFPTRCATLFPSSSVPLCPDSSVPMFLDRSVRVFQDRCPGKIVSKFPANSVPMFPGSSVSRCQCNSAQQRKGSTEENKESFKSRQVFTSHHASVFQRRALRETHRALFLIVIYFHTIYHYLFYKNERKKTLNKLLSVQI